MSIPDLPYYYSRSIGGAWNARFELGIAPICMGREQVAIEWPRCVISTVVSCHNVKLCDCSDPPIATVSCVYVSHAHSSLMYFLPWRENRTNFQPSYFVHLCSSYCTVSTSAIVFFLVARFRFTHPHKPHKIHTCVEHSKVCKAPNSY